MDTKYFIESAGGTYGPADTDQLIQWISEGRVAPEPILIGAETGERTPAGSHGELRSWFTAGSAPTMAPLGGSPVAPPTQTGQATQYDTPNRFGQPGGYPPAPTEYGGAQQQAYRQPPTQQSYYGNAPVPQLGVGQYGRYDQNTSGQGAMVQLPAQLQGLNWGGFFLTFWWSIFNQSWLGLLFLVPVIGWIVPFIVLFKGNEWAWQNRRFESPEHFQSVQKAWATWGVAWAILYAIIIIASIIGGGNP
ncbi:MAG: hypothetical protein H7Y38_13100 [Armatimonadetes bacterium]|nr:hypothetical protein [Armatimonadota bacterium]